MTTESTPAANKQELLDRIDTAWNELQASVASFAPEQLTGLTDAAGWSGKDHLSHLAAWENSMVYLLQGKPRHEGLGVPESIYLNRGEDEINHAMFLKVRHRSFEEANRRLTDVHREMRSMLENLTDADLRQSYSHYLPNEPGTDDGSPIIDRVSGNTHHHFDLHRAYIERIVSGA